MQKGTKILLFLIAGIILTVYSVVAIIDPSYANFNLGMLLLGIGSIVYAMRLKQKNS